MTTHSIAQTMSNEEFVVQIHDAGDAAEFITPDMMGELDAAEGKLCLPEIYFVDRTRCALYAAGWASVNGPSLLSDYWLVGSSVEAIEDDYEWIARGC